MYPHERSLVKKMEGRPFSLVGVNSDKDKKALKEAMQKEHITWRFFWDKGMFGPIATTWNVNGWPSLYVIDEEGIIRYSVDGDPGEEIIDEFLVNLVKTAEGSKRSRKRR